MFISSYYCLVHAIHVHNHLIASPRYLQLPFARLIKNTTAIPNPPQQLASLALMSSVSNLIPVSSKNRLPISSHLPFSALAWSS